MKKYRLSRRQFNAICTTVGLSLSIGVMDALSGVTFGADAPPRVGQIAKRYHLYRRSVRGPGISVRADIRQNLKRKRCAPVFRSA